MRTHRFAALVIAVAVVGTACGGGGSDSPAAPTPTPTPTPTITQVEGVWTGVSQSMSVAGGECVGATIDSWADSNTAFTLAVLQRGSALTAVSTAPISGQPTNYSGTAGEGTMSLIATSSDAWVYGFACLNGRQRDVQFASDTINVTVSNDTGLATTAQTCNVFVAGTTTGVGTMTIRSTFSVAR